MVRVLLLTENVYIEGDFQRKLEKLNYEVLTSTSILQNLEDERFLKSLLNIFQIVIVSESVSNLESAEIIKSIDNQEVAILRKMEELPSDKKQSELIASGFSGWISSEAGLEDMRETLIQYKNILNQQKEEASDEARQKRIDLNLLRVKLTPLERTLLTILMENGTNIVSRNDLVKILWGDEINQSHLSQLSFKVGKIRTKIQDTFGFYNGVMTVWKYGYRLNPDFYQMIMDEKEYLGKLSNNR